LFLSLFQGFHVVPITSGLKVQIALIVAVQLSSAAAADPAQDWAHMKGIAPRGYVCYCAPTAPQIDGKPNEAAWDAAPWSEDFIDIEGSIRPAPRFRTRMKMLWDDKYLYVAASLEEPHVWATLKEHDSVIFHDNDFEVFIDPDGDNHEYYELEINALNTTWDLFLPRPYKDGGRADNSWEMPGLKTAVQCRGTLNDPRDEDQGWNVELAIPWFPLREFANRPAPPRPGDQWRVNFSRVEWRQQIVDGKYQKIANSRENNWVWSPQGIIDMHRPERWGFVQFSTDPPGTTQFAIDPLRSGRDALLEIYHHQKSFFQSHKRWAGSLIELGIDPVASRNLPKPLQMNSTATGFHATLELPLADGSTRWGIISQDSRLRFSISAEDLTWQIEAILAAQAEAWNHGDVEAFMKYYWNSDDLTFSSAGETTRGWMSTKENYRRRYPTRGQMGQLRFSQLEITSLGDSAALVLGRWRLAREMSPVAGSFSLVFRKIDGQWLIIHDHTSRATSP
jgi:ketosteroid isomerase-like protein